MIRMICSGIIRGRTEGSHQDGYILVAVLGTMLLLTSFMAAGSLLVRSALDTAKVGDADVAMSGLTQGGFELTAYQLFVIKAAPRAIDGRRIKFGGGMIAPRIDDESGKADLNGSDQKLLASVFQSAGLGPQAAGALVASVVKMRGPDRNPSAAGTASESPSRPSVSASQLDPSGAKKMLRGFQSVEQLRDFADVTSSDMRALRPLLTVFNPDGKINILSANEAMLAAIPGVSSADIEMIVSRREDADKKQIENLLSTLKNASAYVKTEFGPAFTVRVDATSTTGHKKSTHAVLAASKSPTEPYYVLDWWE